MESSFARSIKQVLENFNVKPSQGLTDAQVSDLRKKHGRNGAYTRNRQSPELATD